MRAHSPAEDVAALARLLVEQRADLVVAVAGGPEIDYAEAACPGARGARWPPLAAGVPPGSGTAHQPRPGPPRTR
jgi:hypothetical protein